MRLLDLAGLRNRARERMLAALPAAEPGWDRDLMIDLLEALATCGDVEAWNALRDLAAEGDERAQDDLATADDAGLQWVVEHVLPTLNEEDRWRIWRWLPDEEADDRTETQRRLRAIQQADDARIEPAPKKGRRERTLTPREFLDGLGAEGASWTAVRDFIAGASDQEFLEAAERLLDADDRRTRIALARIFRQKAFPLPLERLFALADDEAHGPVVAELLGRIRDPAVRAFALARLRRHPPDWNATEMLRASFGPGDEAAIEAVLDDLAGEGPDTQHGVVLDLVAMMFERKEIDWQPFAEWVYDQSPCSFCRASAVQWMKERGSIPLRVRKEGAFDAEPDVRELCRD